MLKVDILHDVGTPINPAIDIGQIEGGFIQGVGWLTTEQLVWNDTGPAHDPRAQHLQDPGHRRRAGAFQHRAVARGQSEDNVGGSKAVGEPPFMLAISVWEALRDAVAAARGGDCGRAGCAGHGGERAGGNPAPLKRYSPTAAAARRIKSLIAASFIESTDRQMS